MGPAKSYCGNGFAGGAFYDSSKQLSAGASYRHYFGQRGWAIEPEYSLMTERGHQAHAQARVFCDVQEATRQAPAGNVDVPSSGPGCLIPGYPSPPNPMSLGLSWCPATVDFQARVFALQAAGASCIARSRRIV